jgi:hypothetical protein
MSENKRHRSGSRGRGEAPEVWACVLVGVEGIDTWICDSEELAHRELAGACRRSWADALDFDRRFERGEEQAPLPPEPPTEDRVAVEVYFTTMRRALPPEYYVVARQPVIADCDGGEHR